MVEGPHEQRIYDAVLPLFDLWRPTIAAGEFDRPRFERDLGRALYKALIAVADDLIMADVAGDGRFQADPYLWEEVLGDALTDFLDGYVPELAEALTATSAEWFDRADPAGSADRICGEQRAITIAVTECSNLHTAVTTFGAILYNLALTEAQKGA